MYIVKESCVISLHLTGDCSQRLYCDDRRLGNRARPRAHCTQVVTDEWRVYALTHKTRISQISQTTVAQVVLWIAKLGGFLGLKDLMDIPELTVLWRGYWHTVYGPISEDLSNFLDIDWKPLHTRKTQALPLSRPGEEDTRIDAQVPPMFHG